MKGMAECVVGKGYLVTFPEDRPEPYEGIARAITPDVPQHYRRTGIKGRI